MNLLKQTMVKYENVLVYQKDETSHGILEAICTSARE